MTVVQFDSNFSGLNDMRPTIPRHHGARSPGSTRKTTVIVPANFDDIGIGALTLATFTNTHGVPASRRRW